MSISSETLAWVRIWALGMTGLACVAYATLALAMGRPDPVGWYWPGLIGAAAAVVISVTAFVAGRPQTQAAMDELHQETNHRAQRHAYWLSLALFVGLSGGAALGWVGFNTAMAAFGCLMGASYLLLFVWYDLRIQ